MSFVQDWSSLFTCNSAMDSDALKYGLRRGRRKESSVFQRSYHRVTQKELLCKNVTSVYLSALCWTSQVRLVESVS